ncbi:MAG: hypothetical protein U0X20_20225 [Caldilineaceae bacterium]
MTSKKRRVAQPKEPARKQSWLWAAFIGAAAILVIGALALALQGRQSTTSYTPEVTGAPSAQIEQTMFDYGDVKLGQTIKTQIPVKNVGDTQLAFSGEPRVEVVEGC